MGNLTALIADHIPRLDPLEIQFRDAMISAGQSPPSEINLDGTLHRYDTEPGKDALWYVGFSDGIPGGAFGSWRDGTSVNWRGNTGRTYSMVEEMAFKKLMEASRAKAETDRKIKHELAADDCAEIWEGLTPATNHPYLLKKGIKPHMARVDGSGRLVIPMYVNGEMASIQTISGDGQKLFYKGGQVKGASVEFGSTGSLAYLAEGFATAATIYEETGAWTLAAFSASNLVNVAEALRLSNPALDIVIIADKDKNGTGQFYADQASAKTGARVIISPVDSDVNDFKQGGGDLKSLLLPPSDEWLIDGDSFTEQPAPIRWMVKKWLQCDSLIMVHGPSGSGKTFVVLDWCLSLAAGFETWRGFKLRPAPVVYLAGEGHHGVKGRMAAWKAFHGFAGSLKNISVSRSGCDLNTPQGLQKVLSSVRRLENKPGLVVVDTLHRFLSGDENSAQDAKTMLDACAIIQAEFSCSVLLVHHTGVSEEAQHRGRGSSAWKGALEIEISIQNRDGALVIAQKKSKDSEMAEDIFCDLKSVTVPGWLDEDGEPVTSAVLVDGKAPVKKEAADPAWKAFSDAFYTAGEIISEGPYLTKSALELSLVTVSGFKESTAKQHVKASDERSIVGKLIMSGKIKPFGNGFLVIDPTLASVLSMVR